MAKRAILPLAMLMPCSGAFGLDCQKAITTPDLNACASIDQKKAEANLNKVYQRVLKTLERGDSATSSDASVRNALVAAQRAWIKFREAGCNAVHQKYADGSIRTVMYLGCMQSHAERRIKDLEEFASE